MKERWESWAATAGAILSWLFDNLNQLSHVVITLLTLCWWIRIWWRALRGKRRPRRSWWDDGRSR
jgi:hypothetical protein